MGDKMMDPLMESLSADKWELVDTSKKEGNYKEYQVMRQHKQLNPNSYQYLIQEEDGDPRGVIIEGTLENKDPLKDIGTVELKLADDGKILGIDIDGEVVVRKG